MLHFFPGSYNVVCVLVFSDNSKRDNFNNTIVEGIDITAQIGIKKITCKSAFNI